MGLNLDWVKPFLKKAEPIALAIGKDAAVAAATGAGGPAAGAAVGSLVAFAVQRIQAAQADHAIPADRKAAVTKDLEAAAPAILAPILNGDKIDPAKLSAGLDQLIEFVLDMLKGTGTLAPPKVAPAPDPTSAVTTVPVEAHVTDRGADGSLTLAITVKVGP